MKLKLQVNRECEIFDNDDLEVDLQCAFDKWTQILDYLIEYAENPEEKNRVNIDCKIVADNMGIMVHW